ncbi:MAG: ureidoglycolate lyase [Oleiphilaceae bacterium]|jgi:ureidoglycolate lyase
MKTIIQPHILTPTPLSAENFAPFGDVIEINDQAPIIINDGNTKRYDNLAKVSCVGDDSYTAISLFRAQARLFPMRIYMMEKHPFGSQSFQPLSGEPYLVLVADAVDSLTLENLHLFLAKHNQGINYHVNTWHHPVLALNHTCDFLVVDRKGSGHNCDEFFFDDQIHIKIQYERVSN